MTMATDSTRAELYPLPYAAALAGLDVNTARRWVRGYSYSHKGERRQSAPVVHLVSPGEGTRRNLTFEQLLTLRLVRAFREKGLGLPTIKKAAEIAARHFGKDNPFVTRAFHTDGRHVFLDLEQSPGLPGQDRVLINALTRQQEFRAVVEQSLFDDVVFVGETPTEWSPLGKEHAVVIRPDRAFGAPHVRGTGVRTDVIADAVVAEGHTEAAIRDVAAWFGLSLAQVQDALNAEKQWRTPKAA